ncbi:hypothetical protein CP10139811_0317 [Chlamydia ibidis]|uniref:Uncharacterized protein n=2 Tax=Chlamydia ibidis TaxID=1405396 RepID=S7KDV4_9CHLA|nr:hypothetical protein [Chlamydia ibidis]EPP34381.1 hypothetical protein CP10139811_0317 [Chlamydia ibidis]EQM63079.1 hypothetical protein H359_0437 [Chlamydia ibidis 10-1398/6]
MDSNFSSRSSNVTVIPKPTSTFFRINRDAPILEKKVDILSKKTVNSLIFGIVLLVANIICGAFMFGCGCLTQSIPQMIAGMISVIFSLTTIILLVSMISLTRDLPEVLQKTLMRIRSKAIHHDALELFFKAEERLKNAILEKNAQIEQLTAKENALITKLTELHLSSKP